jgi:hypothetical protein
MIECKRYIVNVVSYYISVIEINPLSVD